MRPVVWSSSYLFRWPFGISIVTSNCTGRSVADRTPEDRRRSVSGGGHHRVQRVGDRHAPVLAALSPQAPSPDATVLAGELTPMLASPALGTGVEARVVDVASGDVLFDQNGDTPSTPASTAKLLTAAAALTTLGSDATLETTVADLAAQVRGNLPAGTQVTRVVVDNSLFQGPLTASGWGPGDVPSTYAAPVTATAVDGARVRPSELQRSAAPGTDAGTALAVALGAPRATVVLGEAPQGAQTLGTVRSAPVARLVEEALSQSDKILIESLARHVALAAGEPATFDGAAEAVTDAVAGLGLDVTGLSLVDGSGLSTTDRVPIALLADLLTGVADGTLADVSPILSGLPVAGYDGTLADRGDDDPQTAPGSVRAKTGTLLGVHGLAGTVITAEGRLLVFAVLADGAPANGLAAEHALDDVASALAACGCR